MLWVLRECIPTRKRRHTIESMNTFMNDACADGEFSKTAMIEAIPLRFDDACRATTCDGQRCSRKRKRGGDGLFCAMHGAAATSDSESESTTTSSDCGDATNHTHGPEVAFDAACPGCNPCLNCNLIKGVSHLLLN